MKKMIAITATALLAWAAWGSQAVAGGFHFGYSSPGYYGGYNSGYGAYGYGGYGRGYGGGYGGGYGYPSVQRWHDTSHFDYHPGGFARHYNHYHYVPGHYDFHRSGHVDTYHGGPYGGHVHHGYGY
jgi:hypothetical protein